MMVSATSWGKSPRPSMSHPGTRHGVSRVPDAGATGCPVSEKDASDSKGGSRGPQSQPVVEGSMCTTAGRCDLDPVSAALPRPLGHGASAEAVSYEAAPAAWLPLQLPYAPGASEIVSLGPPSCLWTNSSSSTPTEHVPLWGCQSQDSNLGLWHKSLNFHHWATEGSWTQ